ncbi:MAG: class I SAM-dependent methyltransferase [Patescibacteria group bacterium]|jgi:2-polyprenyl-3-methyl-5-hydroxy-6-metoxy-1,4-benzoquinol methylase
MRFQKEYQQIKNNYLGLGAVEKLITFVRFTTTPLETISQYVPTSGKLLDLGCGFGVFSYFFAFKRPTLKVVAIDPSADRIKQANQVSFKPENLTFIQTEVGSLQEEEFDATIVIDVEVLMSRQEVLNMLEDCRKKTKPNGVIIIKTMSRDRFFRYLLSISSSLIIEKLVAFFHFFSADKASSKIFGHRINKPHYYRSSEYKKILEKTGWHSIEIHDLPTQLFFYPNIICLGKK